MKDQTPTKLAALAAAWMLGAIAPGAAAGELAEAVTAPLQTHRSQGEVRAVPDARADLVRTGDGAFVSVSTNGLEPGHVHTMWFVAINAPDACENTPCTSADVTQRTALTQADIGFADGIIADADGTGRFAARVAPGDLRKAWFGNGFRNPEGTEIHVSIADHGPIIPELVQSMLGSYRGGCTDESLSKAATAAARGDGTPGPNTCRVVQFAVFAPAGEQSAALR